MHRGTVEGMTAFFEHRAGQENPHPSQHALVTISMRGKSKKDRRGGPFSFFTL
jgi:hypothetical protein